MSCFHPVKAYRPSSRLDGGRLVFNASKALNPDYPITLPCGYCDGCRIAKSRDAALRCMHEASMHKQNCFATLTFDDDNLPESYSVSVREWQLFMKRLRKELSFKKIRFFMSGEYGDKSLRPHYHSLLFNHDFSDKVFYKTTKQGHRLYTSELLSKIWPYGLAILGDCTYQSAAYCARYIMKKIKGDIAVDHYTRIHPLSGKVVIVEPEFCLSSRRPGLGSTWFDRYAQDCFPSDFLVVEGKKHPVPKYYMKKLQLQEEQSPQPSTGKFFADQQKEVSQQIKRRRVASALPRKKDNTRERLLVREEVLKSRLSQLVRTL